MVKIMLNIDGISRKIKIFKILVGFVGITFIPSCREAIGQEPDTYKAQYNFVYSPVYDPVMALIAKYNKSPLQEYFTFKAEYPSADAPYVPFNAVIGIKKEFAGTASFYSCDMGEFRLLDVGAGEFINKLTYKIYAKQGQILTLGGEYYTRKHPHSRPALPPICGEVFPADKSQFPTEPYIKETGWEFFDSNGENNSAEELIASLSTGNEQSPPEPFAVARAKRLLKTFPREKVSPILAELISWLGDNQPSLVELVKIIIGRFGGKEAVPLLTDLLKSSDSATRIIGLDLLMACGKDALAADGEITELLASEKDDAVRTVVVSLAKSLGIEVPLNSLAPDEIPQADTARYKKEISKACEEASALDITENNDSHVDYDDNGDRLPLPENVAQSISSLDTLIEQMPNYPEMARVYLLLGILRQKYQDGYHAIRNPADEYSSLPPPEIEKYGDEQYVRWGPGDIYYYNSWHFMRLLKIFPDSPLAPDAAYEIASKSFSGGEPEEETDGLYATTDPLIDFLKTYPTSHPALKAISHINTEFKNFTDYFKRAGYDITIDRPGYSAGGFKDRVEKYDSVSKSLPLSAKAVALDEISELWEILGENEKAKTTAEYIVGNIPKYSNMSSIKERLKRMENGVK